MWRTPTLSLSGVLLSGRPQHCRGGSQLHSRWRNVQSSVPFFSIFSFARERSEAELY